jgi:hypothetical protein
MTPRRSLEGRFDPIPELSAGFRETAKALNFVLQPLDGLSGIRS